MANHVRRRDPTTFERSILNWDEPRRAPHDGVLALYHDLLALRPELGRDVTVDAPSDNTLSLTRSPFHVVVALDGPAQVPLPSDLRLVLHTEQGGYTTNPRPPAFKGDAVSFSRAGAAIFRAL